MRQDYGSSRFRLEILHGLVHCLVIYLLVHTKKIIYFALITYLFKYRNHYSINEMKLAKYLTIITMH